MSRTEEYLKEAFAGESQANRKYLAFAEKAKRDGYAQVARLFRAVAEAETVHAHNHLRALKAINITSENLKEAINGETHEFMKMYPEMLTAAQAEGDKEAERTFKYALEVEKIHEKLYSAMLAALGTCQDEYPYFVCPVCGYTCDRQAPDKCPICNARGSTFKRIE